MQMTGDCAGRQRLAGEVGGGVNANTMLYIFGGLPGAGKSTLSLSLARYLKAVYLRIDSIEQAIRNAGGTIHGPEGYTVGYMLAADNLRLGHAVIADSVNPLRITRDAWCDVAVKATVPFVEIEVMCSDKIAHRERVESRSSEILGLKLPTWEEVTHRGYEIWDRKHIVLDTAEQTPDQSFAVLLNSLKHFLI